VKNYSAIATGVVLLAIFLGTYIPAMADAGVFTGNGQDLRQITSRSVQLVSIDVAIIPGRGRFLYDGTVPGMDQADYNCTFVLRSLSDKAEDIQVGFPVDSEFARQTGKESSGISPKESKEWVLEYSFIARDDKTTYHVEFVRRKRSGNPGDFGEVFVWNMHFAPKETRTLTVQYRIPISTGLVSTRKDEMATHPYSGPLDEELVNIADLEEVGYITSTGSSWAGNVERATFTVITEPYEQYLNVRGWFESPEAGMTPEQAAEFNKSKSSFEAFMTPDKAAEFDRSKPIFPVKHSWWFREISPAGWKNVDHGVQWSYKDYKPKDAIQLQYYITELPRFPEELDPFVDQFLKHLGSSKSGAAELNRLKQLLLATYGKEPEDSVVKQHAAGQLWYEPRKDFTMASLSKTQKAVLKKLDERIAAAPK